MQRAGAECFLLLPFLHTPGCLRPASSLMNVPVCREALLLSGVLMLELTLVSRGYCHLCHDMELALQPLLDEFSATLRVVDVDADPQLEARYDELVPVLLHGEVELCHYFLDEAKTREYLARIR